MDTETFCHALSWYVLHSKPHMEEALWRQVQARGFEAYYPHLRVRPVNPRARTVRPYFPRYLFVRANLEEVGLSVFQWMPGAIGLVCFGGVPAPVPSILIEAIRLRVDAINATGGDPSLHFKPGDRVRVVERPFAGYEGIFDVRLSGRERARILLQLLNDRVLPLEVRLSQLKRV
ncbi:MAG: transcription termination/antitermination NusG family protein [Anaerolineae bacterium]|nr:transcription termination/antitermination NusG family protein [Anaerolineae bacterium]